MYSLCSLCMYGTVAADEILRNSWANRYTIDWIFYQLYGLTEEEIRIVKTGITANDRRS